MRRSLSSTVLTTLISISFIFSVGCNNHTPTKEISSISEEMIKEYDLRERCGSYCIDYFYKVYRDKVKDKSDNYAINSDYVSHYNKKMNKCYMLVKSQSLPIKKVGPIITTEHILDAHENKIFGVFTISYKENVTEVKKDKKIKELTISGKEDIISECKVSDEKCKSKEEWDKLIKPYMEQ